MNYNEAVKKAIDMYPNSPLLNWFNTNPNDWNSYNTFASNFSRNASAAYNMMAYAHARGDYSGKPDFDAAYQSISKSLTMHKGPNALDSQAEIAAMEGDFKKAVDNQLKALDYATFASLYHSKLVTYWRTLNKEDISKSLKEAQVNVQKAIEDQNLDEWKKYILDDMKLTTGDSQVYQNFMIKLKRYF